MKFWKKKPRLSKVVVLFLVSILTGLLLMLSLAGIGAALKTSKSKSTIAEPISKRGRYYPGELLVAYRRPPSSSLQRSVFRKAGISKVQQLLKFNGQTIQALKTKKNYSAKKAIKELKKGLRKAGWAKKLIAVEPIYYRQTFFTPNDSNFSNQWGLNNTGQTIVNSAGTADADIDAVEAWDIQRSSSSSVVAVIDSGIDFTHPDLSSKIWENSDEIANNRRDDDNNGYIDDVNGYNFAGISQLYYNASEPFGHRRNLHISQSIKGTGQPLTHVGLFLRKIGLPESDIRISIRTGHNGSDLRSFTINPDEVGSELTEIYKALNSPITLSNGQTYLIVVRALDTDEDNFYRVALNSDQIEDPLADPYRDGTASALSNENVIVFDGDDLYFRTNANAIARDDNGHGTHVAGIIGAATDNNTGIAGVSPEAKIMPVKVSPSNGSYVRSEDLLEGINYAAANGADVINMSMGGFDSSTIEQDAVTSARNSGVVIFAAAGNDGASTVSYPASYDDVISVAATTNTDSKASFSNTNAYVDISAPGKDIYSTLPTYNVFRNSQGYLLNYDYMSGTSMATPMASGLAALLLSKYTNFSPAQVEFAIRTFLDDLGAVGRDDSFGYGRINASKSMAGDTTAPYTPNISSSTHPSSDSYYRNRDATFSWVARDNLRILGYSYTFNQTSDTSPDSAMDKISPPVTYRNLADGTHYIHVKAVDYYNNWSKTAHFAVNIDNYRPRTRALGEVTGTVKQDFTLPYRVEDPFTGNHARVNIVITRQVKTSGQTVATYSLGVVSINKDSSFTIKKISLLPGSYRYNIYAIDLAGNPQYNISYNTLTIR